MACRNRIADVPNDVTTASSLFGIQLGGPEAKAIFESLPAEHKDVSLES